MAKFDRQVGRQKKSFVFTKKEVLKKSNIVKKTLQFKWIPRKWSSLFILVLDFVFVTVVAIPMLMTRFLMADALLLGHGIITSLLIVMSFYHLESRNHKPSYRELILRYIVVGILMFGFSVVSIWVL